MFTTATMTRRALSLLLVVTLAASACSSGDDDGPESSPSPTSNPAGDGSPTTAPGAGGSTGVEGASGVIPVRLSEGQAQGAPAEPLPVVEGSGLDPVRVAAILQGVDPIPPDPAAAVPFAWPAETLLPPRAGATVDIPFPQAGPPPIEPEPAALEVLRFQPEGDVAVAPTVSVTFNQPMIALGTVAATDAADVPVVLTPDIDGTWRWLGTRTAVFEASVDGIDRLPMATQYRVEIPAGTASAAGTELAVAVSWTFTTPAPTVIAFPADQNQSLPLDTVFVAVFDQRIDPAAVLDTVTLSADGQTQELRLATDDEVAADEPATLALAGVPDGRALAFRATETLPADAEIEVDIGPGTPSAEGPLTTSAAQTYRGRTYAPLTIDDTSCEWGDQCPAGSGLVVSFNNALDAASFDPASVAISPELADLSVGVSGDSITVRGRTLARTTYTVTVPGSLTDTFGQQLGAEQSVDFAVDQAQPALQQFPLSLTTIDPHAASPALSAVSINHDELRVRLFAADPAEWGAYVRWTSERSYDEPVDLPSDFELISDETISVEQADDIAAETSVDVAEAIGGATGHAIVVVEATEEYPQTSDLYWLNRPAVTWVQATDLGVDLVTDGQRGLVWVTSLTTGQPVEAEVELRSVPLRSGAEVVTAAPSAADGIARPDLPVVDAPYDYSSVAVARAGDDLALLPVSMYGGAWQPVGITGELRWFIFDDRGVYRPGETVSMKGWIRRADLASLAHPELVSGGTVSWTAYDAQYVEVAAGTAELNPLSGFDLTFDVPAGANEGFAWVELTYEGSVMQHNYQVLSFRRPEFEVTARNESPGPYLSREPATVAVEASYYAGGPLPNAPVAWTVSTTEAAYAPPGWEDFHFGVAPLWWEYDVAFAGDAVLEDCCFPVGQPIVETFDGATDGTGSHYLQIDFAEPEGGYPDLPVTVSAEATVTDVNRQVWASTTHALVHPGRYYVGLASSRPFVEQGTPLDVDVVVTDIDGAAVPGRPIEVTAERLAWVFADGQWNEEAAESEACTVTSASEPVACTFATPAGGRYRITSVATDDAGGASRTEITVVVSGGQERPSRVVEQEQLTVVPDREEYQPGETATLLVQSPFAGAVSGLLTVSRGAVVDTREFALSDGAATIEVPVTDDDIPGLDLQVEVVGSTPRIGDDGEPLPDAPPRVAYAVGVLRLPVPPTNRTLEVVVSPLAAESEPGTETAVDVVVTDSSGAPVVGAEVALVVVDEAVLALSEYQLGSPIDTMYAPGYGWVQSLYGRGTVQLVDPDSLVPGVGGGDDDSADGGAAETTIAASEQSAGGDVAADSAFAPSASDRFGTVGQGTAAPIDVRTNFEALAVFEPAVATGADGRVSVTYTLPDNLTRYRAMAVAVSGAEQFGSGEANLTARLPLMARPSAPRFANFGDRFELPVVLQNQTDGPLDVEVVLETTNLSIEGPDGVPIEGAAGRQVTIPAHDRIEVRFPVATVSAGTARFRVVAVSGELADAALVELPVFTPATAEAFATYGVLDEGAVLQPLDAPEGVVPQFGGLEISTSSTALQALTDAVVYLNEYPYDSVDASSSRILAIAALRPVLEAFDVPDLPRPAELDASVAEDLARLGELQNGDGGFSTWQRGRPSEPFVSVQALHALAEARQSGYSVDGAVLDAALTYAQSIESHLPPEWSQETKDMVTAYAIWARDRAGDRDPAAAFDLWDRRGEELPLDALAWVWGVIDDAAVGEEIARIVANRAVETAGQANFTVDYGDDAYLILHSDRRTDGIVLDALIDQQPDSDLIPKVVAGLMAARTQGRWDNLQENAFILLALKRYFETYEGQTPQFVARVWLGERFAGAQEFTDRSTDRNVVTIPTADVIAAGDADIVIGHEGSGRLYYRLGLRYAPDDLVLEPLDRGFVVERRYVAIDDPADVSQDPDGTWHIRAGARVRVQLSMVADSARTNMALIDPLPAGLEIQNPDLAITPDTPADPIPIEGDTFEGDTFDGEVTVGGPVVDSGRFSDWSYPYWLSWFDHQNRRDDRAEAFAGYLPAGVYTYSYVARATTPGTFVVPPARAEEIYAPETFGRSGTATVVVAG